MYRSVARAMVVSVLLLGLVTPALAADPVPQPPQAPVLPPATQPVQQQPVLPVTNSPYRDVPQTHWAYSSVVKLLDAGVLAPDPQAFFRPEEPVRRAELVKMIMIARRKDTRSECQGMFVDAPCNSWFAPVAEHAYRMGIVDGVGVDQFGPDLYVTREQLFTMLVRALGRRWEAASQEWSDIYATTRRFGDSRQFSDWALPPIALAVKEGIAAGYQDGTFRPGALASRAEAAALVSRVVLADEGLSTVQVDGRTVVVKQAFNMTASMYAIGEPGVGHTTYTGMKVRVGAVAVDPRVIPLGKLLYIEGYGYAVAADIGGAIKGNRVDLFTFDHSEAAIYFGMQTRKVWVLP